MASLTRTRRRKILAGLVIFILLIGGLVSWKKIQEVLQSPASKELKPLPFEKLKKIAVESCGFKRVEHAALLEVENTSFARMYPDFLLFKIWGYREEEFPYPSSLTIAVNKFSGETFRLPAEFEKLNRHSLEEKIGQFKKSEVVKGGYHTRECLRKRQRFCCSLFYLASRKR